MARYHGKAGQVFSSTTGAGVAALVASVTAWTLDMATDKVEVTSFGDANKTYVQGLKDVKGTISGFWEDSQDVLFDGADSADGVNLYLYPASTATSRYFYGPAFLDTSINVGVSGAISLSSNFVARGSWGRMP